MMPDTLSVAYVPLVDVVPYARNARTHSPEQIAQIAASISEFGWTNPILLDGERGVLAGHGRILAAQLLRLEKVPCIDLVGLTENQRRAYVLADNKIALNAAWDDVLLREELSELMIADFDIASMGFDLDEVLRTDPSLGERRALSPMGVMEYRVIVDCHGEQHQGELLERFKDEGLQCRALIS